ncbi:hypothetical protein TRSC58_03066 [Trypanosoma rangeli SC58]|uniref:Uncharacterized protein n=1 Tax=Trypanosoma rangeli SC58 TaxID=429131 RepID=A0A061J7F4_TRYRA|nr:hypothetical protein TRSC58_03066 [Trypanosoma rangeli SC58]
MNTSLNASGLVVAAPSPLAVETSCATMAGTTLTSRSRACVVQHRKETTKATVKEVDIVHRGLKRLETRMHELESRVQYVNPWVVQYMWEMLCDLRDKIGMNYSRQREKAWMTNLRQHGHRSRGEQLVTERRAKSSANRGSTETTTAARVREADSVDGILLTTPMRLFEESNEVGVVDYHNDEGDALETSVSSESDDDTSLVYKNGAMMADVRAQGGANFGLEPPSNDEGDRLRGGRRPVKNGRLLTRYIATADARWEGYRVAQEECNSRMEIALEETTQRSFLFFSMSCSLANALHQRELGLASAASSTRRNEFETQRAATQRRRGAAGQRQRERLDELDGSSPSRTELPGGLSPIEPTQSPSEFFSPQRGSSRRSRNQDQHRPAERGLSDALDEDSDVLSPTSQTPNDRSEREMAVVASLVLKAPGFMRQVVEEVSRQLAVQIQQVDTMGATNVSPSQLLPSALLLTVREAVSAIAGAHDEAFYCQLQECLAEEQRQRASNEERLWKRVADQEEQWTRLTAMDRQNEAKMLQEHQKLTAVGREDAKSCSEIRRELLKLCGEVVRAVERMPDTSVAPLPRAEIADRETGVGGAVSNDKVELRLETLSAAVDRLYSEVELLRRKSQDELTTQAEWRKKTEGRITTLQESMVDAQEAVSIVARKSRAVEERLDASKAEKKELITWAERLQSLERQMEVLPSTLTTIAPPPPPLPPSSDKEAATEMNLMSVEDAMMCVQRITISRSANMTAATDPYVKAVTALCATLRQVSHLYNIGTGTFGGSLRLIFAMPPLSVPSSLAEVCQTYLREHSAAELKDAIEALNLTQQVARVLCDCYYWMQSHLLVVSGKVLEEFPQAMNNNTISGESQPLERAGSLPRSDTAALRPKIQSFSTVSDAKCGTETLSRPQGTPLEEGTTRVSGHSAVMHTEPLRTAEPLTSARVSTSSETNFEEAEESPRQGGQGVGLVTPTALEALAIASSPTMGNAHRGVVHHFHYHHSCDQEEGHLLTSLRCGGDRKKEKTSPKVQVSHRSKLRLNAEERCDTHGTCWWDDARGSQALYHDVSCPAERLTPSAVSSLNLSHIDAEKRTGLVEARTAHNGYTSMDLPPTPSTVNECLLLPTAASCFIDPQQVKHAAGGGLFSMKNPQPFYTAVTRPWKHSQSNINNSDGPAREKVARFTPHLTGDKHANGMRHSPHCHLSLHSSVARCCGDVPASALTSHLRQSPYTYRGDKLLRGKQTFQR